MSISFFRLIPPGSPTRERCLILSDVVQPPVIAWWFYHNTGVGHVTEVRFQGKKYPRCTLLFASELNTKGVRITSNILSYILLSGARLHGDRACSVDGEFPLNSAYLVPMTEDWMVVARDW